MSSALWSVLSTAVAVTVSGLAFADDIEDADAIASPEPSGHVRIQAHWGGQHAEEGAVKVEQGSNILDLTILGATMEKGFANWYRLGVDVDYLYRSYETPPGLGGAFQSVDDTMNFESLGVSFTAVMYRDIGRLELYGGGGIGIYSSKMTVSGSTLGVPGEHEESDMGLGTLLRAGFDYRVGATYRFGLELRKLDLEGSFGPLTYDSSIPIGATCLIFTMSQHKPSGGLTPASE